MKTRDGYIDSISECLAYIDVLSLIVFFIRVLAYSGDIHEEIPLLQARRIQLALFSVFKADCTWRVSVS